MNPILNIRSWFDLEEAADLISQELGSHVSESDLLHAASMGKIPLSAHFDPFTLFTEVGDKEISSRKTFSHPLDFDFANTEIREWLELKSLGREKEWLSFGYLSFRNGKKTYEVVKYDADDIRRYVRSIEFPESARIVIKTENIQAFVRYIKNEQSLGSTEPLQEQTKTSVSQKEHDSYLKVIQALITKLERKHPLKAAELSGWVLDIGERLSETKCREILKDIDALGKS